MVAIDRITTNASEATARWTFAWLPSFHQANRALIQHVPTWEKHSRRALEVSELASKELDGVSCVSCSVIRSVALVATSPPPSENPCRVLPHR